MLALNNIDFRFRKEDDDTILAYDVIRNNMYFLKGNTGKYIENLMNNQKPTHLEDKYIKYLIEKKIIIEGDVNET